MVQKEADKEEISLSPSIDEGEIPIDSRVIWQLSQATVKSPIDAIVELVTNSEDAYRRSDSNGDVVILMRSLRKGGPVLGVRDDACGMTYEKLKQSLKYGARSSGQKAGSGIRGLLGRGLKEAILGLGEGRIITVCDGRTSYAEVFRKDNTPRYLADPNYPVRKLESELSHYAGLELPRKHGTIVLVRIQKEMPTPREKTMLWEIENHHALRKIVTKPGRKVLFRYQSDRGGQHSHHVEFKTPHLTKVMDKNIEIGKGSEKAHLTIYESEVSLDPEHPAGMCYSKAGILISTEDVVLDNKLWRFENESSAYYFLGELDVPFFAKMWESEDFSTLTPERNGLDWRSEVCRTIATRCMKELAPLIASKKERLESPGGLLPEERKRQFRDICKILNDLIADLDLDLGPLGPGGPMPYDDLRNLIVVPDYVRLSPGEIRSMSIYAPKSVLGGEPPIADLTLSGPGVSLVDTHVELAPIKQDRKIFRGYFRVEGKTLGQTVTAKVSLHGSNAYSTIEVTLEKKRGRKKKKREGKSGPFSDIRFDPEQKPIQPVKYESDSGIIRIFVEFPFVRIFIRPDGSGLDQPASRAVFADLVGEAFCSQLARKGLESGRYPLIPGSEIDNYQAAFNDQRLHAMRVIHEEVDTILAAVK